MPVPCCSWCCCSCDTHHTSLHRTPAGLALGSTGPFVTSGASTSNILPSPRQCLLFSISTQMFPSCWRQLRQSHQTQPFPSTHRLLWSCSRKLCRDHLGLYQCPEEVPVLLGVPEGIRQLLVCTCPQQGPKTSWSSPGGVRSWHLGVISNPWCPHQSPKRTGSCQLAQEAVHLLGSSGSKENTQKSKGNRTCGLRLKQFKN